MAEVPKHHQDDFVTPYGTVLGSYEKVPGRSNGSDHYYSREQHFHNGLYTGAAFQCVEYARRWLQSAKGLNFHNIPFAAFTWDLQYVERISDSKATSMRGIANGSTTAPVVDSFLIWPRRDDDPIGHIAVITEVSEVHRYVRIAEQNKHNDYWPGDYARQLPLDIIDGQYWIRDDPEVRGWMVINFDVDNQDESELNLQHSVQRVKQAPKENIETWVDFSKPAQKIFSDIWGADPTRKGEEIISYYRFESHFSTKILFATMELNMMCMRATEHVLKSAELLARFGLPVWTWEFMRSAWESPWTSGAKTFSGRFDLGFNGRTIKMFEYNADSAGTYFEAGLVQDRWAKAVGCDIGKSAGAELESLLAAQAQELFKGLVHLMVDNDDEEIYSALYLQEIFGGAGVESKIITGMNFTRKEGGGFLDADGVEIKTVWKMWNWETIVSDFEKERVDDKIKISDIMLDPRVVVYEPIWKLITSNKALLPVLWELWPNHPYLLRAQWNLDGELRDKPHAKKPIVGRCGQNVEIVGSGGEKLEESQGNYASRDCIYQEIFEMEKFDGFNPVIGSWMVGMKPAGFGIREDTKLITDHESPYGCCRIVN